MSADLTEPNATNWGDDIPRDELANFLTHGLGLMLSILGSMLLMQLAGRRHDPWLWGGCAIYSLTLVGLYAASTLSHTFFDAAWRRFFKTLDQACIFLLIAGSFTPFAAEYLRDVWWLSLLAATWLMAIFGVAMVLKHRRLGPRSYFAYAMLGWFPGISLKTIVTVAPPGLIFWVVIGGLFYSAGILFLCLDHKVRFFHALWHTFVIAGSICHFVAVLLLVVA